MTMSMEYEQLTSGYTVGKWLPLTQQPLTVNSSSAKDEASWVPPLSMLECWWDQLCAGHHSFCEFLSEISMSYPDKRKAFHNHCPTSSSLCTFFFLTPSLVMLPESWGRRWCECPIVGWTLNSYLFSVIYPVISLCINHYPLQKKTSHVRLRAALIYGSKHKYLHIFRKLFGNMTILEKQQ